MVELNIHASSHIPLGPSTSWSLGHLLSGDLWPLHCGVTSLPNITVSGSPGKMSGFITSDERRTTAASKPGSTQ